MNALAVCSIDFNPKLQIEISDEKIILILTWYDCMFFLHRMYVQILMLISYVNVAGCGTGAHIMMTLNSIANVNDPQEHLNLEF